MVLGKREHLVACVSEGCLVAAGRMGRALKEVGHGRALGCCSVAVSYVPSTGLWAALRAGPTLGGRSANVCRMQLFTKLPREKKGRCRGLGPLLEGTQRLLLTDVPPGALTSTASSLAPLSQPDGWLIFLFTAASLLKCKPARGRERLCQS